MGIFSFIFFISLIFTFILITIFMVVSDVSKNTSLIPLLVLVFITAIVLINTNVVDYDQDSDTTFIEFIFGNATDNKEDTEVTYNSLDVCIDKYVKIGYDNQSAQSLCERMVLGD